MNIQEMLTEAIKNNASDVHINVSLPPIMRINTELMAMKFGAADNVLLRIQKQIHHVGLTLLHRRDLLTNRHQ